LATDLSTLETCMRSTLLLSLTATLAAAGAFAQTPATPTSPATPATPVPAATPAAPAPPAVAGPDGRVPPGHFAVQLNQVAVELAPTQGNRARGELVLSPDNHGLRIAGELTGLKANSAHGFHIHAVGDCSAPDASSAGDHFNPGAANHGEPGRGSHHAGDLPNARSDGQGTATISVRLTGLTLGDGGSTDVLGKAIVVHADRDDYSSQPAGNAGARIACGVIARAPAAPAPVPAAPATPAG
jgi:Cu-Zn family superoxide dismutase